MTLSSLVGIISAGLFLSILFPDAMPEETAAGIPTRPLAKARVQAEPKAMLAKHDYRFFTSIGPQVDRGTLRHI